MRKPLDQKLSSGATIPETGYVVSRRAVLSGLGVMTLLGASGCSQALELPSLEPLEPSGRMSPAGVDHMSTGAIPPISVDSNITDNSTMYASLIDNSFVTVMGWYDNEWGFSNRMVDVTTASAKTL